MIEKWKKAEEKALKKGEGGEIEKRREWRVGERKI